MHSLLPRSFACGLLLTVAVATGAQMVSPTMDAGAKPFSYFSQPTDQLGLPGDVAGAEITPEGFLYTGFGELMWFVGPEQTPLAARVRTLEDGRLPIYHYSVEHLGIEYSFVVFAGKTEAAKSGGEPATNLFARVTMTNSSTAPRAAFLTTAMRHQAVQTTDKLSGDNRFVRPIPFTAAGQFHQPGETFDPKWIYEQAGDVFLRGGRVMYTLPQNAMPAISMTLRTHYNRTSLTGPQVLTVQPTTPTLAAAYTVVLAPGESKSLDFKVPLIPPMAGSADDVALRAAGFNEAHEATAAMWRALLGRGMRIEVPEAKVSDTFQASLAYDAMVIAGQDVPIQTVNEFQYHRFYLRDVADFIRMYDATGYADLGSRVMKFLPTRQTADGNFLSQPGQYDGWGEALWIFGEHYRRTQDLKFARALYPRVVRAVEWLVAARAADPLHVMPQSDVRDNEYVAAHLTGYNFLALDGLGGAIELAEATGHAADAGRFRAIREEYRKVFFALLDAAVKKSGGFIPPALDAQGWQGTDWGNLLAVTPEPVLAAHDARVTATLAHSQGLYQEGITTYSEPDDGVFLHHYLTIKNTLTETVRGEDEQAVRELYAELLHTSSTHAGFEYAIRPWGSRDFEGNIAPHGWFAADYRNLLRNMMVREEDGDLHLLSVVSPEWVGAGKTIRVEGAPSYFGMTNFTLSSTADGGAHLQLRNAWTKAPKALVLHFPWFVAVSDVTVDGKRVAAAGSSMRLPIGAREVVIHWRRNSGVAMSYAATVASYEAEYARRYAYLLQNGKQMPMSEPWAVPEK